eukprot:268321_1
MKHIVIVWAVLLTFYMTALFTSRISEYFSEIWMSLLVALGAYISSAYSTFIVRRKILKSIYGKTYKQSNVTDNSILSKSGSIPMTSIEVKSDDEDMSRVQSVS